MGSVNNRYITFSHFDHERISCQGEKLRNVQHQQQQQQRHVAQTEPNAVDFSFVVTDFFIVVFVFS